MQELVQLNYLLHSIRLSGLLPVTKRRIRDPDLVRHSHWHMSMVERDLRRCVILIEETIELRLSDILQFVLICSLLKRVSTLVELQHVDTSNQKSRI